MSTGRIQEERVQQLNEEEARDGDYVLYWMQSSQRADHNHALEYALQRANERDQRLLVVFGLTDDYPEANLRHYAFMLEGLKDVEEDLGRRGIKFVVRRGSPDEVALGAGENASLIVTDRGYMRPQKRWRKRVAEEAGCPLVQVETDVVVPVELASGKQEHAARTLRPKIHEYLDDFLVGLNPTKPKKQSTNMRGDGLDLSDIDGILEGMDLDRGATRLSHLYRGGSSEAKRIFRRFLKKSLQDYDANRNQPQTDYVSHMSKYLHYGHVSPIWLALEAKSAGGGENTESFVEELIVRRELSMNFVFYNDDYDSYANIPGWAKETLEEHKGDDREHTYTRKQLENAQTHDEYWNAAMKEMVHTGYMHNYMRMYWGKKILEWSGTPEHAYKTTLYLNNKYFLDGRDPNSFANVAWVFGQHDRGWTERPVFGKVRYMAAGGLERKAKPARYVEKVERLIEEDEAEGPA